MNIYLVERKDFDDVDYDQYYGFVVIAESPDNAKQLINEDHDPSYEFSGWPLPHDDIEVTDLGIAHENKARIVQGSFNAG